MKLSRTNLIALAISTLLIAGCIDPQRIREMSEEMTQNVKRNNVRKYLALKEDSRSELQMRTPCCDDLTKVRPSVKFRFDTTTATVSVGSMFDNRVLELDGHRSFYGMFDFDGPLSGTQRIDVSLMATPGYADPESFDIAGTMLFPDFLYLDSDRREIGRTQITPSGNGRRMGGIIVPLAGTHYIVVYSSKESLAAKAVRATFAGGTSAMPIGGAIIVVRTPPGESIALPATKGSVTLTLIP